MYKAIHLDLYYEIRPHKGYSSESEADLIFELSVTGVNLM